ncbi:tannase/feruloyl esterase family alpha/beta hydrolase [Novosphingobium kaempferiae]|uniref:tannase/feruloyl esterase family alpha/beta hydrolase n=1 Tax=Novosphingobium kaempferiae TaxID=2896849 RepID=UPI001E30AB9D|nr:tannase/feruloyl esterase family alpha/beta hydrolase [Novosphingobium kaempferiae]
MKRRSLFPAAIATLTLGLLCAAAAAPALPDTAPSDVARADAAACQALGGDADLRATFVSATAGTNAMTAHCRVDGVLRPVTGSRIGYVLLLPLRDAWSGRFQMLGNGGYSSRLPTAAMTRALARGSAVIATDTGHDGDDPDFAIGKPEAIVDWGWRAVHLTAQAGKALSARFYGKPAHHSYFDGCSTGGHQGMMEAQRFPTDFDGIIAGAPGADRVRLNAAFLWQFLSNHARGENTAPLLAPSDLALLEANSRSQCGKANGRAAGGLATDAWIVDPLSCHPDLTRLACRPGGKSACLSPAKLGAARAMYRGAPDGLTFPWLPGSEAGWNHYWADPADPTRPMRVNFWRVWAFGAPDWNWWSFDYGRDLAEAQAKLSPVMDATDPDLSRFRAHGGKLLQYHGLADPVVSPLDTLAKRQAMIAHTGDPQVWYRLFLVPGMNHCTGGGGFTRFDAQDAIERWVERDRAPEALVAQDDAGRTRPLCPYPQRAVLTGRDTGIAQSYTCKP